MRTAEQTITRAIRIAGGLRPGQQTNESQLQTGLEILNAMLDQWDIDRLAVYHVPRETYTLTAGTGSYTLGPGGDFDQERPVKIEFAGIVNTDTTPAEESPVQIYRDAQLWAMVAQKLDTARYALAIYPEMTFPLITVNVWPVPDAALDLALYAWARLLKAETLAVELAFPPGYENAVVKSLAVELAQEWRLPVTAEMYRQARAAKADIERVNAPRPELRIDPWLTRGHGYFDIETGRSG